MFQHKTVALKKIFACAVGAAPIFSLVVAPSAHAKATPAQVAGQKAIAQSYDLYNRALKRKDIPTMMSFLAPDYEHYTVIRLRQNKTVFENLYRKTFSLPVNVDDVTTKITKIQWRGPDAIVWTETGFTTRAMSGNTTPVSVHWAERDYWSPTRAGWKMRQATELKMW